VLYVAGIISLGAVVAHGGLGARLGEVLAAAVGFAPGAAYANLTGLAGSATLVGLATTLPGVPAVMTPLADMLAGATGLARETVIASQVIGFSTVLLPYQAPPLVVAMHIGGVRAADMARCTLALAAITYVVLMPLTYGWWRVLGLIG
jgi:di/tricarboxylate transporter